MLRRSQAAATLIAELLKVVQTSACSEPLAAPRGCNLAGNGVRSCQVQRCFCVICTGLKVAHVKIRSV